MTKKNNSEEQPKKQPQGLPEGLRNLLNDLGKNFNPPAMPPFGIQSHLISVEPPDEQEQKQIEQYIERLIDKAPLGVVVTQVFQFGRAWERMQNIIKEEQEKIRRHLEGESDAN